MSIIPWFLFQSYVLFSADKEKYRFTVALSKNIHLFLEFVIFSDCLILKVKGYLGLTSLKICV